MTPNPESVAIVQFLGRGVAPFPKPDAKQLVETFEERATEVASYVEAVLDELYRVPVDWETETLDSGTELAVSSVASRHPKLSEEALEVLRWKYSWDWR
jgi:hypothetical protein